MSDANERLRRLLSVIPLFAESPFISRDDLARRTGVPVDVLLDDLRVVTERLDTPGGFVEDLRVEIEADRIAVHSSHFQRPMRITAPELCALELGLAMLRASTPPDEAAPIARAREKVRDAMMYTPAELDDVWHASERSLPDNAGTRTVVRGARESRKAVIVYQSGKGSHAKERVIHPYHVMFSRGSWYVVAHCELSNALRFFRTDRIQTAALSDETFTRPDTIAIDELLASGKVFQGQGDEKLVVRYSPRVARWISEREGREATPDADGYLTLTHQLGDDYWAVRHVLQYGAEAVVISPARIRNRVCEVLALIAGKG